MKPSNIIAVIIASILFLTINGAGFMAARNEWQSRARGFALLLAIFLFLLDLFAFGYILALRGM